MAAGLLLSSHGRVPTAALGWWTKRQSDPSDRRQECGHGELEVQVASADLMPRSCFYSVLLLRIVKHATTNIAWFCRQEDGNAELEEEVASGLQLYFDQALGQMLLYAAERPQFVEKVRCRRIIPAWRVRHCSGCCAGLAALWAGW